MKDFHELLNTQLPCTCGRVHFVPIKEVNFHFHADQIGEIVKKWVDGERLLVIVDRHTDEQINHRVIETLQMQGFELSIARFNDEKLVPNEGAVGAILMAMDRDTHGIVAVGSGTINDLARFVGSRIEKPVISIATAPSMDGYAAAGSSLVVKGAKKTLKGVPVTAIYGELNVISQAPFDMIQAGFGDIIGKKTSLADWALSRLVTQEYWCDDIVALMDEAADTCIENGQAIAQREPKAIGQLMDALVLSGVAMSLADDTRPASGAEHMISHFMVMKDIEQGKIIPSHGITVAFGTLVVSHLYEFLLHHPTFLRRSDARQIVEGIQPYLPSVAQTKGWLKMIGLPLHPEGYAVDRALLGEIIRKAGFIRDRFTIFTFLDQLGLLEEAAVHAEEGLF
jgi:glycerol-1-phosphate dehydrogenase [NAD(P)+]